MWLDDGVSFACEMKGNALSKVPDFREPKKILPNPPERRPPRWMGPPAHCIPIWFQAFLSLRQGAEPLWEVSGLSKVITPHSDHAWS